MSQASFALAPSPAKNAHMGRRIVVFGASLAFLSFLDRAAISQAAPVIMRELHLSPAQMGLVFSAFGITYAAGEIPSGRLCDRLGARLMLTRVVVLWSLFTAATGWAWNFSSLFVIRLLFGLGESGCFPSLAHMFRGWLTPEQRNAAEGIKAASARWGAAITPLLMASMLAVMSWRWAFGIFGVVGLVWSAVFWRRYRNPGDENPAQGARPISWSKLVRARSVWALGVQWFCHYYGFYFYITWLPIYLLKARGLDLTHEAFAATLPLIAAGLGSLASGFFLTWVIRKSGSIALSRKMFGYFAYGGASVLLLTSTVVHDAGLAIVVLSLSGFAAEFSSPISWTTAMDIGGENVGSVSGFMNTLGHFGGALGPGITGFLLSYTAHAWSVVFYVSAAIYAIGALCWAFIDPVRELDLRR